MNTFKRILVVSRMIQTCKPAIQKGVELARCQNAELFIIHPIHNPFGLKGWSVGTLSLEKEYQRLLKETREKLSAMIEAEKSKGMTVNLLIPDGEPTKEILNAIGEKQIDLLIMLAHEEGFLENLLFNRSTDELVQKMPCSILLVKNEPQAVI